MFFRIYSGFSRSLYESMSNFDRLFLLDFLSNRIQLLAQWSLGIEVFCYDCLRNHSCSSCFIQDFRDHYVDQCRFNDVHVGWSPMKGIIHKSIGAFCQMRHDRLSPFEHPLHLIIKIHIFSNVSCGASVADSGPALNQHWVFDVDSITFQMLHFKIELTVVIPSKIKRRRNVSPASQTVMQH